MGATAFVNITREHPLGEMYKIFDPTAVVPELPETVDGDAAVVDARARAVAEGYRLALDDYDGRASHDPLTTRDEPPRDYRRLHFVRTWSHGEIPNTSI